MSFEPLRQNARPCHALLSNNIIGDNSIAGHNATSAVLVRQGVSDFIVTANHAGGVFKGQGSANHRYGVEIEGGTLTATW